jgi:hypothetical protein
MLRIAQEPETLACDLVVCTDYRIVRSAVYYLEE